MDYFHDAYADHHDRDGGEEEMDDFGDGPDAIGMENMLPGLAESEDHEAEDDVDDESEGHGPCGVEVVEEEERDQCCRSDHEWDPNGNDADVFFHDAGMTRLVVEDAGDGDDKEDDSARDLEVGGADGEEGKDGLPTPHEEEPHDERRDAGEADDLGRLVFGHIARQGHEYWEIPDDIHGHKEWDKTEEEGVHGLTTPS